VDGPDGTELPPGGRGSPGLGSGTVAWLTAFSRTVGAEGLGNPVGAGVALADATSLREMGFGVASPGASPTPVSMRNPCVEAYRRIASFTR